MCEAFRLAINRAVYKPPIPVRYAHTFPEWGHNVANELTKTIFKGIVGMAPKKNESNEILAGKAGQLVGVAIRAAVFYGKEVPALIEREGLNKLTKEQNEKLEKMAGWELLLPHASELAGRPITGKAELIKFYGRRILHFAVQMARSNLVLIKLILYRPVEEIFRFLSGIPKGFKSFLKTDGEFAGKGKRTEIFLALLMYWPEIEEMRQSQPPKTRKYLLDWLEKEEGRQLVTDDKIFFELCDDISLDLTIPGHPFKLLEV
jgi:hypothetical protein